MRIKHNINQYRQTKILDYFSKMPSSTQKVNNINVGFNSQERKKNNNYLLQFDGASKGNPGKAGAGAVIYLNNNEIWNGSKYIGNNFTCNYAEYYGLIMGLEEAFNRNIKNINVEGDSQLVINQLNGKFQVKSQNLIDLYTRAKLLSNSFDSITFTHIYRTKNQRADELANLLINK